MTSAAVTECDVAIIGGGVGGLALAAALDQAGVEAHVFEKWPDFGEVGGHLTIDNYAIEVLDRFGVAKSFLEASTRLHGLEIRAMHGGGILNHIKLPDLGSMGVDDAERTGTREAWGFLRSDLVKLFASHVPDERLHTDYEFVSLVDGDESCEATFANGETVRAKLVVGADGARSIVRQILDDAPSENVGVTICRVNAPADLLPADHPNDRLRLWDGNVDKGVGSVALTCPVRGGADVAIDVLFVQGDQLEDADKQDVPVDRVFARLPDDVDPLLIKLIEGREGPIVAHGLYDREVAKVWSGKSLTIIGDAAHAMRPNLGQGACQSIHDAGALSTAIAEHGLNTDALHAYEAARADYVRQIVAVSKSTPPTPEAWDDDVKESAESD